MSGRRLLVLLAAAGAAGLFLACLLGATPLSPGRVLAALLGQARPGRPARGAGRSVCRGRSPPSALAERSA